MTDDDCGCRCTDCGLLDIHRCGRPECGYTKYAKAPATKLETAADAIPGVRAEVAKFASVRDPEAKARLAEWRSFCEETAPLEYEIRKLKRAERYAEIFGGVMA